MVDSYVSVGIRLLFPILSAGSLQSFQGVDRMGNGPSPVSVTVKK